MQRSWHIHAALAVQPLLDAEGHRCGVRGPRSGPEQDVWGCGDPLTLRHVWAPVPEMGNGPEGDRVERLYFWMDSPMLAEVSALLFGICLNRLSVWRGYCVVDGLEKVLSGQLWIACITTHRFPALAQAMLS